MIEHNLWAIGLLLIQSTSVFISVAQKRLIMAWYV